MQRSLLWSLLLAGCTTPNPDATIDQMRAAASSVDFATFEIGGGYPEDPAPDVKASASDDLARGAYEALVSEPRAPAGTEKSCVGGPPWYYTVLFFHEAELTLTGIVYPECGAVQLVSAAGATADGCDVEALLDAFGLDRATADPRKSD